VITGLFLILLAGAAFFSLERVLFADASFILFRIINVETLQIQEHRYGSFITQLLPLLAAKWHLPLGAVVLLYSLSFNLFYLCIVLLLLYRFKEQSLAILMSLYFVLFVSDTWFWMNNEVHQGIAWMFLFFAVIRWFGKRKAPWPIILPFFLLLAFLALYTHPLVLFPMSFLWLFFITKKDWPYSRFPTVIFSGVLMAVAISKIILSAGAMSYYDVEKLQGIKHISFQNILGGLHSPFTKELLKRTSWNYWLVPVLFITGLYAAWKKKAYWHAGLSLGFALFYFAALCVTFNDFQPFYTESELMPASILFATPFVFYAFPKLKQKQQILLLASIFVIRLAYIGYASPKWTERKAWIMTTLEKMREQHLSKAIVHESERNKKILIMNWGTPCESIIASALRGDKPQQTFVVDKPENLANRMPPDSSYMIASFELMKNTSLNNFYFSIDTTANYQPLK
jgi:hypothetical protein